MRLSEAVSLAFHASAVLASDSDSLFTTPQIAAALSASEAHLSKVMQRLVKAGLVTSTRGPNGGFRLARPAANIMLVEIYEAIEGAPKPIACLMSVPLCDGEKCILGKMIGEINRIVIDNLTGKTLAQLAAR